MTSLPRFGFARVDQQNEPARAPRPRGCPTQKVRYKAESEALVALIRVRDHRAEISDPAAPENRVYRCDACDGWHLSSKPLHPQDIATVRERADGEPWQSYSRRLERKIEQQRTQIVSLLAIGHGGSNRELRKRVPALLAALAEMTERWHGERRNREALVRTLRREHPLRWLLWRLTHRRAA